MAGQPSQAETKAFGAKMKESRTRPYGWSNITIGANLPATRKINSNRFPDRLLPDDPFDTDAAMRQQLVTGGAISAARPLPYTEKEISYLKNKRDAEEYAGYQVWLGNRYNLNDPANQKIFKNIAPSYFNRRKELIKEQIDLTSKYAQLRLMGPETEEDLQLQYMVETGRVTLPKGPLWDPETWMEHQSNNGALYADNDALRDGLALYNKNVYQKGLFNPFLPLTMDQGAFGPNDKNMADINGLAGHQYQGPYGARGVGAASYGIYAGANLGYDQRNNPLNNPYYTEQAARTSYMSKPQVGLEYPAGGVPAINNAYVP